jgi:hypothetical protein
MGWPVTTWIALVSALSAVAAVFVMFAQRAADAQKSRALLEGLALLRVAADGFREEVVALRREVDEIKVHATGLAAQKLEIARQKEARLEADRKWKAGMELLDRLSE